jgi:hypothetical protein
MAATASSVAQALLEQHLERLPRSLGGNVNAVVECELLGPGGPERRLHLQFEPGRCRVNGHPARPPAVTVSLAAADLVRLLEGEVSIGQLFMGQRLMLSGDVLLASRLPQLLGLPRSGIAAREASQSRPLRRSSSRADSDFSSPSRFIPRSTAGSFVNWMSR